MVLDFGLIKSGLFPDTEQQGAGLGGEKQEAILTASARIPLGTGAQLALKMENNANDSGALAENWSGGTFSSVTYKLGAYSLSGFPLTKTSPNSILYTNPWTIAVWFRVTGTTGFRYIWDWSGGGDSNHGLRVEQTTNELRGFDGTTDYFTAKTVTANTWNLVVMTYDGATTNIYLNGSASPYSRASVLPEGSVTLKIGAASGGADAFVGFIDQFLFYNVVLTTAQIDEMYNSGSGTETLLEFDKKDIICALIGENGSYYLWPDESGRLRIKSTAPTAKGDGTIVGTQTA